MGPGGYKNGGIWHVEQAFTAVTRPRIPLMAPGEEKGQFYL